MDSKQAHLQNDPLQRFAKELVAGGLAGACSKTLVAPLERVKILMQTDKGSTVLSTLQQIYKSDGITGLFRGNGAGVTRIVPYAALHFSSYEHYRSSLVSALRRAGHPMSPSRPPTWVDLAAGSCSGATAVIFTYPLDLVRTKLAYSAERAASAHRGGIVSTIHTIARKHGVAGLYRGAVPTLLGIFPYAGFKFYAFQQLKRFWQDLHPPAPHQQPSPPPLLVSLLSGGAAGLFAQTATYPLDVVRRRMQVSSGKGMVATAAEIWAHRGARGFYRGLTINYLKVTPATAVGFMVYDAAKRVLKLENQL